MPVPTSPSRDRRPSVVLRGILLALGLCGALVVPVRAQSPDTPPQPMDGAAVVAPPTIGRISVEGNLVTDSTRILRTFEVRSGQTFASDAVRRGTRKLIGLGLFSNVVIRRVLDSERNLVDLVIVVTERPRIARIRFEGMKKREESDLEKKLFLKVGETYSATATSNQADTLRQYYRDEGFPQIGRAHV